MEDAFMLQAFSPTGERIVKTVEWTTGTMDVACFYGDANGGFGHETDGAPEYYDPETMTIEASVVYEDAQGQRWLEAALTYQTEEGTVVRQGQHLPPFEIPDIAAALNLAHRAAVATGTDRGRTEADYAEVMRERGWPFEAWCAELEHFVRDMGLMPAWAAHVRRLDVNKHRTAEQL